MAYTTIDDPTKYFVTVLYTGNDTARTITTGLESTDMIWNKRRDSTGNHLLYDDVRGVNVDLNPDTNELNETQTGTVTAFGSDSFNLGTHGGTNANGETKVNWCWAETATAGFDMVTATGNATAKTISHSLSAVPHWIISKEKTGSVNDWVVYHHKNTSAPETDYLILNEANATADSNTVWNDTAPTSSVFTVGTGSVVNRNSSTYIYYLWTEIQGYSKFGSFTGNNNADGIFVYTGFKPAWVMTKSSNQGGTNYDWVMFDNKRNTGNPNDDFLDANNNGAEVTSGRNIVDFCSNGFKCRSSYGDLNSNYEYVYMAFAEAPFVNSKGVPVNAR
tara:strand:+ start:92 stop:1090 length:999 start_codon:yes stop_codon:yes gene_type:complete